MESFFQASASFNSGELREFLIRRYGQTEIFMKMSVIDFAEFLSEARKQEKEEKYFAEWCALIPRLNDEYLSFENFKKLRSGANIDSRPAEEILAEIDEAHRKDL